MDKKEIIFDLVVGVISLIIIFEFFHENNQNTDEASIARNIAEGYFREFTKPTRENSIKWGMKDFRIIGYNSLIRRSVAGKITAERTNKSANEYKVNIPCCCKGTDVYGKKVELIRNLELTLSGLSVVQYSFRDERPIKITDRVKFWAYTTFIFPFIIFGVLSLYFCICFQMWLAGFYGAFRGTRFIGTLNSVYTSYICWDSIMITILGVTVYISIYFVLVYFLKKMSKKD